MTTPGERRRAAAAERRAAWAASVDAIASAVPDLRGLVGLLEHAGQIRMASALRARLAERSAVDAIAAAEPKPDAALWLARAGGGQR